MQRRETAPGTPSAIPLEMSLPKASFVSETEFRKERDSIIFADWFCVGRAESLIGAGDFLTADVVGESVIVVRDDDGGLRGFYNLCRHRGSRLAPPEEAAPAGLSVHNGKTMSADGEPGWRTGCFGGSIRCPYHAWTYGLDGTLRSAPFLPDLRRYSDRLALHPVAVTTWGGFVFARLDGGRGGRRPLARQTNGADGRLAAYPLAELRSAHRIVYRVAANWKVICENYNECYHCGPVHPELCDLIPAFRRGGGEDLDWDAGIEHRDGTYTFTTTALPDRMIRRSGRGNPSS